MGFFEEEEAVRGGGAGDGVGPGGWGPGGGAAAGGLSDCWFCL